MIGIGIGVLAALYVLYVAALIWLHPRIIYPFGPDVFAEAGYEKYPLPYKDLTPSIVKDTHNAGGPVVLFFMGNGGALDYFTPILEMHRAAGRQVYALEYPGGGGVPRTPSEGRLKLLAWRAMLHVQEETDGPIIVHGVSMGTGLAQYVATKEDVAAVVLDSPFARMCELMAAAAYVPACYLPGVQKWDSLRYDIDRDVPVLIQHGDADRLIPLAQGQKLFARYSEAGFDVELNIKPGAGHNDLAFAPDYAATITRFLADIPNK